MISSYLAILSDDFPIFLHDYLTLDILQRLKGIGLFCGCDYTSLFPIKTFYSRYDHSLGVALIIWHFTHDKKQTIAGLLHDVSSPVFSHAIDFFNGDYLQQESTEERNIQILEQDSMLHTLLKRDGISFEEISDYKRYPIADNPRPQLSADRLEYTLATYLFVLHGSINTVKNIYQDLYIDYNEISFSHLEPVLAFMHSMHQTNLFYLSNEDKLALQLLADILKMMYHNKLITMDDLYSLTESEIIHRILASPYKEYFHYFQTMTSIHESDTPVNNYYHISLDVKRRYIDPLLCGKRISTQSEEAASLIHDIKSYQTPLYAYIELEDFRNKP